MKIRDHLVDQEQADLKQVLGTRGKSPEVEIEAEVTSPKTRMMCQNKLLSRLPMIKLVQSYKALKDFSSLDFLRSKH